MTKRIYFIRHAKTPGNIIDPEKGIRFLGRYSDVEIIRPEQEKIDSLKEKAKNYDIIFASPVKRTNQSLELITDKEIIQDSNLHEINYGDVDGMFLKDVQEKYPYLFEGWSSGKDPRFPNGENSEDVLNRYKTFMKKIKSLEEQTIGVCTHNAFLRTVIGYNFDIPMKDWFKMSIPHFEEIEFEISEEGKLIYKGNEEQKTKILKNL